MRIRPAALIIERNCVLTMRYRYGHTDVYALPGGNPDPGETLPEVIVRELREELCVETEVYNLVCCGEVIGAEGRVDTHHAIFLTQLIAGLPRLNPEHTSALSVEWLAIDDLKHRILYPNIGAEIEDFFRGQLKSVYLGKIAQPYIH